LDRKLKLRADHWSEGAAQVATSQGLQAKSFERAATAYSQAVGGAISAESVRLITEGWGAQCEAKRAVEAEAVNAPAQRGERPCASRLTPIDPLTEQANISSDGAKLLIRGEGWKEVKMTAISAVHVQAAAERALASERPSRRAADPLVRLTRHSYQAGLWEVDDFARQQYAEGVRRGLEQSAPLSSVNDGAAWIERTTRENFPEAIQVIDWSHVEERVGGGAQAALGADSAAAHTWIEARLDKLWEGKPGAVLSALRHLEAKAPRAAKTLVRENIVYFQNQQPRMHYDQYRAAGLPLGSGTVESAATTLVHLRLKRPGRGWCRDNAQSMLAALSEFNSGRFELTWRAITAANP
jgi:hypothetical protein